METTKTGPAGPSADVDRDEQEKKKRRNRLSQRAFRRRRAESLRELQERINADQRPENEQVAALQQENARLRAKLVEVETKLSRLAADFQAMSDDVAKTLDEPEDEEETRPVTGNMSLSRPDETGNMSLSRPDETGNASSSSRLETGNSWQLAGVPYRDSIPNGVTDSSMTRINTSGPMYQQIPDIWTFEYQMGMQPYADAMTAAGQVGRALGKQWIHSNSPFSDHIDVLHKMLKDKLSGVVCVHLNQEPTPRLYQTVLMVLAMFNSMTRPDVMAWYARTRFYHIIELTAWQLFPSAGTYERLHERYRPTQTQLQCRPHPLVIDWIPFPSIRDRLIRFHAANPAIDQIFCDAVSGYVVEASMPTLILGAPDVQVYIRVTDLVTTMSAAGPGQRIEPNALPAPDTASLFREPGYAAAAFAALNMDRGASYYKIDPAFFGKYPELYDAASAMTAEGLPLKPDLQVRLTWPKPLDATIVETYRSFINFSLDAARTIEVA